MNSHVLFNSLVLNNNDKSNNVPSPENLMRNNIGANTMRKFW